jgi:ubiquinone/menaquinone biosynthesis C-methylase UbiE
MVEGTGMGRGKVYPAEAARHLLNPLRRLVQPPSRVVRAMQLRPADRVLELGCGPGWFSPTIAAAVPSGWLTLCDLQPEMLAIATERTAAFPHVTAQAADATALPFASGSFDLALVATMLGEVPDRGACLAEVHRVLVDGGVLAVSETRRDSDFIELDELEALAAAQGFAFVDRRGCVGSTSPASAASDPVPHA